MEEKKEFNAKKGLLGYDALTDKKLLIDALVSTGHSDEDVRDYISAKKKCLARGGNWQKERGPKFDKMANDYYKACRELEEMD